MLYIYLKNRIISNKNISDNVIAVYVALRKIYLRDKSDYYISINSILYELFGSFNYKRQDYINISNGLADLQNNPLDKDKSVKFTYYYDAKNKKSKKEFIINLSELDIDKTNNEEDYYTTITDDELKFIMNYGKTGAANENQINNYALLRYFIFLISTINFNEGIYVDAKGEIYKDFVGYQSHKYLADNVGISENTLIKFNSILEENKILYCKRNNKNRKTVSGEFRSLRNHYGRYKDKEYIDKFNEQYLIKLGLEEPISKKQTKQNQSLANKYYQITKGRIYDDLDVVKEIYNYIHKCNVEIQKQIDSKNEQSLLSDSDLIYVESLEKRLRDESIFDKYGFNSNDCDQAVHNNSVDTNSVSQNITSSVHTNLISAEPNVKEVDSPAVKVDNNPFHEAASTLEPAKKQKSIDDMNDEEFIMYAGWDNDDFKEEVVSDENIDINSIQDDYDNIHWDDEM